MAQQADLADCASLLAAEGYTPLALKGAFLARHAWPHPALRPMRDLDLLVPEDQVVPAWRLLVERGYAEAGEATIAIEDHARFEQHMPPLFMPRGSVLELHARISERDGRLEYRTPAGNEEQLIARAVALDGIGYPCPTDMLAHLVIHAVYGHRFDCGPLLLGDVHYLVQRHAVDWDRFWQAAHEGQWADGAALVTALVRDCFGGDAIAAHPREPARPDADVLDLARDLLVQDYTAKKFARFAATIMTGGFGYVWRRATSRVAASGDKQAISINRSQAGGRLGWAWGQTREMWSNLANSDVRRQSRQLARFRRWLER